MPLTLVITSTREMRDPAGCSTTYGFEWVTIRPATVCGYSPRRRLDLSVNILTNHAVNKGTITVFGGIRNGPTCTSRTWCALYPHLLALPGDKIHGKTYNCGFREPYRSWKLPSIVKLAVEQEFPDKGADRDRTSPSQRQAQLSVSTPGKIPASLALRPKVPIEDAVRDLCKAFRQGQLPNSLDDDLLLQRQERSQSAEAARAEPSPRRSRHRRSRIHRQPHGRPLPRARACA